MRSSLFPSLGLGLGLRGEHFKDVLRGRAIGRVEWFEVVTENFLPEGGRPLAVLEEVRKNFPVVFHGVSMNLGSVDPLDWDYLKKLKQFIQRFEPAQVSDHCCWTGVDGINLNDLNPLPLTEEALTHVTSRIAQVQDFLGRRILVENVSSYLTYSSSEMTEWEFLSALAHRADCGLLLDVNNVYVSSVNHGFDPVDYLCGVPAERVGQIHLAGHTTQTTESGELYLIDTHSEPVCPEVWELYGRAVELWGDRSAMIEWDDEIPKFSRLLGELRTARAVRDEALQWIREENETLSNTPTRRSSALARSTHL